MTYNRSSSKVKNFLLTDSANWHSPVVHDAMRSVTFKRRWSSGSSSPAYRIYMYWSLIDNKIN